jgi:protein SCO1/2
MKNYIDMRYFLLIVTAALIFSGCKGSTTANSATGNASATAKRYVLKGKVVSVDKAAKKATIDHEAIEGYMDAMTMAFPIHDDWLWDDLTPGSEIRADLVVDNAAKEPFWLENVGIIAEPRPGQSQPPINEKFAQIGKDAPDFSLTNQDGKHISLKDFRGKTLAITFIYAKCPLPDYCIRMSQNFSDLANELAADPEYKDKLRLLSISFDPANDTPAKLREYGLGYLGKGAKPDFTVWQLAVGKDEEVRKIADFYNLRYEVDPNNKAQISHSLRTIVITPEGKVAKIFAGNEWTPGELLRELKATLDNNK